MYTFCLSVYSNTFDLPHFQAEFVKKVLKFDVRKKTEEELNTKVMLICATYKRTHIYVYFINVHVHLFFSC